MPSPGSFKIRASIKAFENHLEYERPIHVCHYLVTQLSVKQKKGRRMLIWIISSLNQKVADNPVLQNERGEAKAVLC